MGLLKLQTLRFKYNDRLFYNKYRYSLEANFEEVGVLRGLRSFDIGRIDRCIAYRKDYSRNWNKRNWPEKYTLDLKGLAEALFALTEIKWVLYHNSIIVYSNELDVLTKLSQLSGMSRPYFNEAIIDRPFNSIKLKETVYKFRSYLKLHKLSPSSMDSITRILKNNRDELKPSPTFSYFLIHDTDRLLKRRSWNDTFFIDHVNQDIILMLNLVAPGIIKKTVDIINRDLESVG